jgi:3-oxoacyl-[acyl-carrier-protein] synthase-1
MPPEPLALTATTIVSAIGHGKAATASALLEGRTGLRANDFDGTGWIGRVDAIEAHSLPASLRRFDCRNNRLADMALETDGFAAAMKAAIRRYGADRIAVIIGTSTSGVLSSEEAFLHRGQDGALPDWFDYDHTHDMFSSARYVRAALGLRGPALVVSTACASSAKSFIDAGHLMAAGLCDAAVVGGVDTLCRLTLRGFASLELVSPTACRPCDAARAGISVGEAAGFALLERGDGPLRLLGVGATSDGFHMSSPHPQGAGAIGAMQAALAKAGLAPQQIDYVNLHGTGTKANDAMEDEAVTAVFGPGMACSSTKGWTGHTLGACGILGAVIAGLAIEHGMLPGCLGMQAVDPAFRTRVIPNTERSPVHRVAVNSFGFGGANCTLLLGGPA